MTANPHARAPVSGFFDGFKKGREAAYAERHFVQNKRHGGGWSVGILLTAGTVALVAAMPWKPKDKPSAPERSDRPSRSAPDSRRIVLTGDHYGHFHTLVTFIGPRDQRQLPCMVDSGASWLTIGRQEAAALGFDERSLRFSDVMYTANGETRDAPITLRSVSIAGRFTVNNASAEVDGGDLDGQCLLGMSVLRLMHVSFSGGAMELSW
jgi:clan AA aspartic protease (TIGR02281 family)